MIYFLLGYITGLSTIAVLYAVIKEIIFKYGKEITTGVEKAIQDLQEHSINGTSIIYPDSSEDVFKQEDSILDDLLDSK